MSRWRVLRIFRQRRESFDAALRLLLEDHDVPRNFLRATRDVVTLVHDWQSFHEMERDAPRRADIARLLRQVDADAGRLMTSLRPLSRHLTDYMHVFAPPILVVQRDPAFGLGGQADIHGINDEPDFNHSGLYARLLALRGFCRESLKPDSWLGNDDGGGTTVYKESYGSAKWQLVYNAALLYANYQEDRLSSTEGGTFYRFCAVVYELATNRTDSESIGLKRYVQFAAPRVREICVKHGELMQLQWPAARGISSEGRIWELQQEIRALHSELAPGPKKPRASTAEQHCSGADSTAPLPENSK